MGPASLEAAGLFGRSDEVARITAHLDPGRSGGGPRAIVMTGVPGIGKSRLMAEVIRRSSVAPVRRVVGFEPEQAVSLAATATLLRDLASQPLVSAQRLASLMASTAERSDGLAAVRVFEAATAVVLATTPSLLVIDDLQWLDDMSRALVHHMVRAAVGDGAPLLVLCASRPAPQSQAWAQSIRSLFGDGRYDEIELTPLDAQAGVALARARNPSLSQELAEQIWAGADGSPFWISLQASGGAEATEPGRVLTALLRMLTDDAARLLGALVVFSRPVVEDALAAVVDWPLERSAAALAELVSRGLATDRAGVVATTHDLVRETAIAEVPVQERARLHQRIADHLAATASDDLPALMEAIEHATAGGGDPTELALRDRKSVV